MLYLDLTLPTIEENLALDEALLQEVEEGRLAPLLRTWEFPRPAVVLGASGRIGEDVIAESCARDGVPIARRSSGGGTVVVGPGALNFTVVLARDFAAGLEAVDVAQHYVLERVASQIRGEGPAVEVLGSGDLALSGRKVAGSAQRRLKRHFLVHASILYDFPLEFLSRYTRVPTRQPSYRRDRTHEDFVANLGLPRATLLQVLRSAWDACNMGIELALVPEGRVREAVAEKFGRSDWTYRL